MLWNIEKLQGVNLVYYTQKPYFNLRTTRIITFYKQINLKIDKKAYKVSACIVFYIHFEI